MNRKNKHTIRYSRLGQALLIALAGLSSAPVLGDETEPALTGPQIERSDEVPASLAPVAILGS